MAFNPKLSFQVSPVWLTGPPVANMPNKMLPIIAITDPALYSQVASQVGAMGSYQQFRFDTTALDDAFGAFQVMPGGSLIKQDVAQYPFANQYVAGNATIFSPLEVSLIWDTPMRGTGAWANRMGVIGLLQAWLFNHNNDGGTFTVVTPSFIYENMLLTSLTDSSRGQNPIPQNAWRWDFTKPMIRITDLAAAQSALMSKLTAGTQTDGSWSGVLAGSNIQAQLPQFTVPGTIALPTGAGGSTVAV
jgi:hypothetical protein